MTDASGYYQWLYHTPKKVAVLACGPSLTETWTTDAAASYDLVIGVNTVAWVFPVDWLAFLDKEVLTGCIDKGMLPKRGYITHALMKLPDGSERIIPGAYNRKGDSLTRDVGLWSHCCNYTFPCALQVAREVSAGGAIDVYGYDIAVGKADCAHKAVGDRSANRFGKELAWVGEYWPEGATCYGRAPKAVIAWLNRQGSWQDAWQAIEDRAHGKDA